MTDYPKQTGSTTWHVLGTGSIACLWSAYLAMAGHPVRMIRRHPPPREAYHGIRLCTAAGETERRVVLEALGDDGPVTHLLACTKAYDLLPALARISHRLDSNSAVVLLQNGMGFQQDALQACHGARIFCALSTEGAWCPEPFTVNHAGKGATLLGQYPGGTLQAAQQLIRALPSQWLEIRAVMDIQTEAWRKLAVNCAINALTAVHGCSNGALLEPGAAGSEFVALCAEIAHILASLGQQDVAVQLAASAADVARRTAANRSSMLQDVSAGRRTEIDYINGFLCREAAAHRLPCPLNRALCEKIHRIEQAYR